MSMMRFYQKHLDEAHVRAASLLRLVESNWSRWTLVGVGH